MHYEFKLSGVSFGSRQKNIMSLKQGDLVYFHRETYNSFDKNAILVTNYIGQDIGYVPRERNTRLASQMNYSHTNKISGNVKKIIGGIEGQFYGVVVQLDFDTEIPAEIESSLYKNILEYQSFYHKSGAMRGKMNFEGVLRHVERIETIQSPNELIYSLLDILSEIKRFISLESLSSVKDNPYYLRGFQLASSLSYQVAHKLFLLNLTSEDIEIAEQCEKYILDSFFLMPSNSVKWVEVLSGLYIANRVCLNLTPSINLEELNNKYSRSVYSSLEYITE